MEGTEVYLRIFLDEARKCLLTLQQRLISLETGGCGNDDIEAAYRAAHTLKGDAATMGYEELAALAYQLECPLKRLLQNGTPLPEDFTGLWRSTLLSVGESLAALERG